MAAADTARLLASMGMDDRGFQQGAGRTLKSIDRIDKRLGAFSGAVNRNLGRGIDSAISSVARGVVRMGKGVASAAINWEDAFQGVVKTVDATPAQFDKISAALRNMSTEMPNTALELAGIAEAGGQMGVKANDIEAFTKQVAILASTTDISADDAATALGQLQNVIGLTGNEFDNFAAALVDLGNKGSSTESQILEITRRSGGAAKQIGVAKTATLGWAAAAANLGLNQELAGTSLQNFFLKTQSLVSGGGKTLQGFAKIAGVSSKGFVKAFRKDASGALEKFIKGLGGLSKGDRLKAVQKFFGKGSGLTRLILGLSDSIDKNLDPALDDSTKAWKDATAAQAEFDKRNATVKSAIQRLRNGITDAAVSIGEGFAPALGRASDKLSAFLKLPENRDALKAIGQDIGKALDKIDWDKLLNAAKGVSKAFQPALDLVTKIAGLIASLPPGVIGAGAGLVITDKLSGGAVSSGIGGIIGGLGSTLAKNLASQIPFFGRGFVQHVWVDNPGGVPGGLPIPKPGGGGGAGAKVGGTAGAGVFIADLPEHNKIVADVVARNFKVDDPTFLNHLQNKDQDTPWDKILQALGLKQPSKPATDAKLDDLKNAVNTSPKALAAKVEAAKQAQVDAIRNTGSTTGISIRGTTGAVQTAQGAITAAIAASRPIVTTNVDVNVSATTVEKTTTTSTRYGGGNGSYGGGNRGSTNDRGKGG